MAVHNILADGREVESLKGHKINIRDFPELQQAFINANRRLAEQEGTEEEIGA